MKSAQKRVSIPATGSKQEQGHCFGGARGMHIWAEDAKAFFRDNLSP